MMLTLLEAALRSLLVAGLVAAGLRALRVRNVLAEKAAWGAVLAAAFLMPLLVPVAARWQLLPRSATLTLPAHPMESLRALWPKRAAAVAPSAAAFVSAPRIEKPSAAAVIASDATELVVPRRKVHEPVTAARDLSVNVAQRAVPVAPAVDVAPDPVPVPAPRASMTLLDAAVLVYCVVAGALLFRLLFGLERALDLWMMAVPIWDNEVPAFAAGLKLRASSRVTSPVTIGSSIVLPEDFSTWEPEKLRIVLAHERSHIRQGDFYLQILAGLYAALVWFSPLGWWLKARLSDLAEAISDRAGLEVAASRTLYAQLLLEFAAAPRPTPLGVAMARPHSLTRRIERLLNDRNFMQSFAGGRRALVAALVLPAALMISAALVRVQAAGQDTAQAPPVPAAPQSAPSPATPQAAPTPAVPQTPAVADAMPEAREGQAAPDPDDAIAPSAAPAPQAAPAPPTQAAPVAPVAPPTPDHVLFLERDDAPALVRDDATVDEDTVVTRKNRMIFREDPNGDSYVIVQGSGPVKAGDKAEDEALQKARKIAKGTFVLYTRQGKSYIIDDPATVEQIESAIGPLNLLSIKTKVLVDNDLRSVEFQKKMAEQQKVFAKQQQTIILQQKQWQEKQQTLTAPELKKQVQELNDTVAKLEARQDQKLTNEDMAKLRSEVAELQAKLSGFPMNFELRMIDVPKIDMPKINIEIDKGLAEAQKHVAEAQKQMQRESDEKMKSIIDQSMKNGTARPVN